VIWVGGTVGIAGGLYLALATDVGWIGWFLFAVGAILLAVVVYAMFLLPGMIYGARPMLKNEFCLSFSDDGIRFQTRGIDSTLQWSLYQSWLRDDDFYILYHGKRDFSVIPRRVLTAGGADSRLREMLDRNVGPALPSARASDQSFKSLV
jgi:hypothetical protein